MLAVDPFDLYRAYVGVKAHFSRPDFDYIQAGGRFRAKRTALQRRNDKVFFDRVARKLEFEEAVPFFVSNFVDDRRSWIGDLATSELKGFVTYRAWRRRMNNIRAAVDYDLGNIQELIQRYDVGIERVCRPTRSPDGSVRLPEVVLMYRKGMLVPETIMHLDRLHGVLDGDTDEYRALRRDPVWVETALVLRKYFRFLEDAWPREPNAQPGKRGAGGAGAPSETTKEGATHEHHVPQGPQEQG